VNTRKDAIIEHKFLPVERIMPTLPPIPDYLILIIAAQVPGDLATDIKAFFAICDKLKSAVSA
jgi:hypothetical protein